MRDQFTSSLAGGNYFYSPRSHLHLHKWRKAFWSWIFLCIDGRWSLSLFKIFFWPYSSQSGEIHTVGEEGDAIAGKWWLWCVQGVRTPVVLSCGANIFPHKNMAKLWVAKLVGKRIKIINSTKQSKDRRTEISSGIKNLGFAPFAIKYFIVDVDQPRCRLEVRI